MTSRIILKRFGNTDAHRISVEPLVLVNVKMRESEVEEIEAFSQQVRAVLRVKLTRSFILREGARMLMRSLQRELAKAQSGELHAKKRKQYETEIGQVEKEKGTLQSVGFRKPFAKRRRKLGRY